MRRWTEIEISTLRSQYKVAGKALSKTLGRSRKAVGQKASDLGLRFVQTAEFFNEWQARAAKSKTGRKNPRQSEYLRRLHADGRRLKSAGQLAAAGCRLGEWVKQPGNHPRGMLGKSHSHETKAVISNKSKERWIAMTDQQKRDQVLKALKSRVANGTPFNKHGNWKADWRVVAGRRVYFRSRWEANYARYLEWLKSIGNIADWEHEPETFWFEKIKRGCVSYLPDFRVTNKDGSVEYHEVKGWMDARSKTKIKRMAKYHPKVKLIIVGSAAYKSLASKVGKAIPEWE